MNGIPSNKSPQECLKHILKASEKKWGYLFFKKSEVNSFFINAKNRRFSLLIDNKEILNRKIDKRNRIWIGFEIMAILKEGGILLIKKVSDNKFLIERQQ